jgi:competence protein ComEA
MTFMKKIIIATIMGIFLVVSGVAMVSAMEKVNINTASAEELTALKNVGPKTAQAIIVYRKAHKGFKTPGEITQIKGVGEKTFQDNKDMIVVKDE